MRRPPRAAWAFAARIPHSCPAETVSCHLRRPPAPQPAAFRNHIFKSRGRGEKKIFQAPPGRFLQPPPFRNGNEHRRLHATAGNPPRGVLELMIGDVTETGVGLFHLSRNGAAPPLPLIWLVNLR